MNVMYFSNFPKNPRANNRCPEELDEDRWNPENMSVSYQQEDCRQLPFATPSAVNGVHNRAEEAVGCMETPRAEEEYDSRNELLWSVRRFGASKGN